ncbi:MAG: transposase [Gemmobacter sp.]
MPLAGQGQLEDRFMPFRPAPPPPRTRNRPADNAVRRHQGLLTIGFDPAMIREAAPTCKRRRRPDGGDAPIRTCPTMKGLFGMALQQAAGFAESLPRLVNPAWAVPQVGTIDLPAEVPTGPLRAVSGPPARTALRAGVRRDRPAPRCIACVPSRAGWWQGWRDSFATDRRRR